MASDNLNQVGRYIRDSGEAADRALKKQKPVRPSTERTRDIFDPDIPFEMFFTVEPTQKSVSLDLEFNKPPPMSGCRTGTDIKPHCEEFTLSSGDHEIQLAHAARTGTITVFVNGSIWPTSKWTILDYGVDDTDPADVLVLQLPLETNTVTICYIEPVEVYYTGDLFAALLGSNDFPSQYSLAYGFTGDSPPGGWSGNPTSGPATHIAESTYWRGIEVGVSTFVRIHAKVSINILYSGSATAILHVFINGSEYDSVSETRTGGGVNSWIAGQEIDLRDVFVSAGSTIEVYGTITGGLIGGYESGTNNSTFLRVGRGSYLGGTWVGP